MKRASWALPVLILLALSVYARAANTRPAAGQPSGAAQYAGSDVCLSCHEDVYKKHFEGTPHFQTTQKNGHGCESVNFDTEQFYADHSFTRITFTRESRYRLGGSYTPRPWAVMGASLNLLSNSTDDPAINYRGHNYNYSFNTSLNPRERFGFDVAYNYTDYRQSSLICFNDKPPTGVVHPWSLTPGTARQTIPTTPC